MATATTFTVIKGKALSFVIVIKQNGTTTPLTLTSGDTFTFSIVDKKTGTKYITDKAMTLGTLSAGEVNGSITALESATFPIKKSYAEDGYIPRPNLRVIVNGTTANQGDITAFIENVYVVAG